MRLRVAEVDDDAVAHVLRDNPANAADHLCDKPMISTDHLAKILGIESCRQGCRASEIAEQDRQLSALGGGTNRGGARRGIATYRRGCSTPNLAARKGIADKADRQNFAVKILSGGTRHQCLRNERDMRPQTRFRVECHGWRFVNRTRLFAPTLFCEGNRSRRGACRCRRQR